MQALVEHLIVSVAVLVVMPVLAVGYALGLVDLDITITPKIW